jgi:hypothetical protein
MEFVCVFAPLRAIAFDKTAIVFALGAVRQPLLDPPCSPNFFNVLERDK